MFIACKYIIFMYVRGFYWKVSDPRKRVQWNFNTCLIDDHWEKKQTAKFVILAISLFLTAFLCETVVNNRICKIVMYEHNVITKFCIYNNFSVFLYKYILRKFSSQKRDSSKFCLKNYTVSITDFFHVWLLNYLREESWTTCSKTGVFFDEIKEFTLLSHRLDRSIYGRGSIYFLITAQVFFSLMN